MSSHEVCEHLVLLDHPCPKCRSDAVHDQAMRWLQLARGKASRDSRYWVIGGGADGTAFWLWGCGNGEWFIEGMNPIGLTFVSRRTARALLHAAEIYARGER